MGDARTGDLLLMLSTMSTLRLFYNQPAAHVDFLPQLPRLTVLYLVSLGSIPADAVLASLVQCTGLTDVNLRCGFNSARWSALFAKLTKLKKLEIQYERELKTLRCFAAGPVTQSLEELRIAHLDLRPSELSHLYALRRLRTLRLQFCFTTRLDDATIDSLSPPSALLPALTQMLHQWRTADRKWKHVVRKGSSFDWMEERMTR